MSPVLVAPSILSADFAALADAARLMETAGADWLHVDVMDGHFVPNLTLGPVVVKSLARRTRLPLDVHLMITDPRKYAQPFAKAGAASITFHLEAVDEPAAVIREIRRVGVKAAVSLKPQTPAHAVFPYLKDVDMVLVMTVEPGFGGQAFMPDMLPKVREISSYIREHHLHCRVEVDGGIDPKTAPLAVAAGAQILVAGSAVFHAPDPVAAVRALKAAGARK